MPTLLRTPPQRVARSPIPPNPPAIQDAPPAAASPIPTPQLSRPSEGNTTLPTPSRAFIPRNQKVMRTPPGGYAAAGSMAPPAAPTPSKAMPVEEERGMELDPAEVREDDEMFVEEQILAGTSTAPRQSIYAAPPPDQSSTSIAQSTTPTKSPPISMTTTIADPPVPAPAVDARQIADAMAGPSSSTTRTTSAAAPRTPRTRRNAPHPIDVPVQPVEVDEASAYGKRYEITLRTLRLAIENSALKWTRKDLETIFPLLAAKFSDEIRHVHADASAAMSERIDSDAKELFEHYRVGRATQLLDEVVDDALAHGAADARPDAWRPDLSPEALTAAANLAIYDEAYDRLRTEYLALHADCSTRFASIQAKKAELAELESSVSEGVTELDKTLAVLDGFPTGDMKDWAETTMGLMEGGRVAERA